VLPHCPRSTHGHGSNRSAMSIKPRSVTAAARSEVSVAGAGYVRCATARSQTLAPAAPPAGVPVRAGHGERPPRPPVIPTRSRPASRPRKVLLAGREPPPADFQPRSAAAASPRLAQRCRLECRQLLQSPSVFLLEHSATWEDRQRCAFPRCTV